MCNKCETKGIAEPLERPTKVLPKGVIQVADNVTMTELGDGRPAFGTRENWGGETSFYGILVLMNSDTSLVHATTFDTAHPMKAIPLWLRDWDATHVHLMALADPDDVNASYVERKKVIPELSPWHKQGWFLSHALRWIELLPRFSKQFPGMVAYYQSPQKRKAGVLTAIKPGKFLKKYFSDVLTEEEIQTYGMQWIAATTPPELFVTQDADEIERLYRGKYNGSCMNFQHGGWEGECHPARVYGGPDLGQAYIGELDNAAARCLVWPEKKVYYPKWYGDYHRLEMALEAAGWTRGTDTDFEGARIQRIYDEDGGFYTVPYSDTHAYARDTGSYLVLGRGDIYLRQTNGTNLDDPRGGCVCDQCGERDRNEDGTFYNDEYYCESCADDQLFYCHYVHRTVHIDDTVVANGGERISNRAVERGHAFYCDGYEEYFIGEGYVLTVEGECWSMEYAEEHGFECEFSEEFSSDLDSKQELDDGRVFSWNSVNVYSMNRFADWKGDAVEIGRINHPQQLDFDALLAVAA